MAAIFELLPYWIYFFVISLLQFDDLFGVVSVSRSVIVSGASTGVFVEQPEDTVLVRARDRLRLRCVLNSAPYPGLQITDNYWYKDDRRVRGEKKVADDGTLTIKKSSRRKNKAGKYHCLVQTSLGSMLSLPATVTVATPNDTYIEPEELSVSPGGQARFQCDFPPQSDPPAISWDKNDIPLSHNRWVSSGPVLVLWDVQVEDAGEYTCSAGALSSTATLHVTSTAAANTTGISQVPTVTGPSTAVEGDSAILQCTTEPVTSLPQQGDSTVEWTKDGSVISPDERVQILGMGTLWIKDLRTYDSGAYACSHNGLISEESNLTVIGPPILLMGPKQPAGDGLATLSCVFAGTNYSDTSLLHGGIRWTLNGAELQESDDAVTLQRDGSLLLKRRDAAQAGGYQCWAQNAAGISSGGVFVKQKSSLSVEVEVRSSRKILVKVTDNLAGVVAYSIHYRIENSDDQELQKVVGKKRVNTIDTSDTIDYLKPYSPYAVFVTAHTNTVQKYVSKTIHVVTWEDIPLSAPGMSVYSAGPHRLLLQWEMLPPHKAQGQIIAHQIWFMEGSNDKQAFKIQEIPGNVTEVILNDLQPETQYFVQVLSGTKEGFPKLPQTWPSQTTDSLPDSLTLQSWMMNSTAVFVSWDFDEEEGVDNQPASVKLTYKPLPPITNSEAQNMSKSIVIADPSVKHQIISQLAPGMWYKLSVSACTSREGKNCGAPAHDIVQTKAASRRQVSVTALEVEPNRLEAPDNITAETLGSTSILLKWPRPSGNVESYLVRYAPVVDMDKAKTLHCMEEIALLDNLEPYTEYEVSVKTVGRSVASSNYGAPVRVMTSQGLPSPPKNVSIQSVGSVSGSVTGAAAITVQWSAPGRPAGSVQHYKLLYTTDQLLEEDAWDEVIVNVTGSLPTKSFVLDKLEDNTQYYMKVYAATEVGYGEASPVLEFHTGNSASASHVVQGIIFGVTIPLVCILLCIFILCVLYRHGCGTSRQSASSSHPAHTTTLSSAPGQPQYTAVLTNGNGYLAKHHNHHLYLQQNGGNDDVEMTPLTMLGNGCVVGGENAAGGGGRVGTMTTTMAAGDERHIDAKGTGGIGNGVRGGGCPIGRGVGGGGGGGSLAQHCSLDDIDHSDASSSAGGTLSSRHSHSIHNVPSKPSPLHCSSNNHVNHPSTPPHHRNHPEAAILPPNGTVTRNRDDEDEEEGGNYEVELDQRLGQVGSGSGSGSGAGSDTATLEGSLGDTAGTGLLSSLSPSSISIASSSSVTEVASTPLSPVRV